jgi:hypothetical protein
MSEKKIIYCKDHVEANDAYMYYIKNHIKNVHEAYHTAESAFRDIFPDVYDNREKLNILVANLKNHDKSKFDNEEFFAYRNKFFPVNNNDLDPDKIEEYFNIAWLHHIHNNPHHPNHWVLVEGDKIKIFDMPDIYIIEMLCDWMAMSKYYNSTTLGYWKSESAKKLPMSIYTVSKVNEFMDWMQDHNVHTLW